MLQVLMVEDERERLAFFRALYARQDMTICSTAATAIAALGRKAYDLVHLGYDLADGSSEEVARKIGQSRHSGTVVIHSENPDGREKLSVLVPSAFVVPFSSFSAESPFASKLKTLLARPLDAIYMAEVIKLLRDRL